MAGSDKFVANSARINSIVLTNFNGKTHSIADLVTEINIYENIYNNSTIGCLDIMDSVEMIEIFPIIGEETIDLDFIITGLQTENKNFIFSNYRIFKITDRAFNSDKVQIYKLWFTSPESVSSFENKISKSWKGVTSTDIIKDVFSTLGSERLADEDIEETIGVHSYISTNFSPFEIINYLASNRSINSDNFSDYAFFESFDGDSDDDAKKTKFNFKSLGTLLQQDPVAELNYHPVLLNNDAGYIGNMQPLNVQDVTFFKGFDILESKKAGLYSQTYIYYDILRKKYVIQKNKFEEVFPDINRIFFKNSETYGENLNFVYCSGFPEIISNNKEIGNIYNKGTEPSPRRVDNSWISENGDVYDKSSTLLEETLFRRRMLLQGYENNKIFINDIAGNYKYTVGNVITFNKPHIVLDKENHKKITSEPNDVLISGNYLITKSRHRLTRGSTINWRYKNYLEISKDSFELDLKTA